VWNRDGVNIYGLLAPVSKFADVAQLVEHHLAKVDVAGSSPVICSEMEL
jgi:hypothetical protein